MESTNGMSTSRPSTLTSINGGPPYCCHPATPPRHCPLAASMTIQPIKSAWKNSPSGSVPLSGRDTQMSACRNRSAASMESTPANLSTHSPLWTQASVISMGTSDPFLSCATALLRVSSLPGTSVWDFASTSPRFPRGRRTSATTTLCRSIRTNAFEVQLLQNFQREASIQFSADGSQQRSDRTRGSALLADDLAEITLGNAQLEHRCLFASHLVYHHFGGDIHKRLGDLFYQCLYAIVIVHVDLLMRLWAKTPSRAAARAAAQQQVLPRYQAAAGAGLVLSKRVTVSDGC